jgi:hypothetical protein
MSDAEDRNKALVNFNRSLGANLDKEIAKQKSDLQQGWRVKYSAQFRAELSEAESCEERGNWIEALEHKLYAEMLDKLLKMLDG